MYKLHLLQHPDWYCTGTSYCYFYIFEIIHHHSVIFSKTYPSFLTVKEGSTSLLGLLPSGKKRKPLLPVALNRFAIRLTDHQRSRLVVVRDGTAWGISIILPLHQSRKPIYIHMQKFSISLFLFDNLHNIIFLYVVNRQTMGFQRLLYKVLIYITQRIILKLH